jgi:hypothetical protein
MKSGNRDIEGMRRHATVQVGRWHALQKKVVE